MGGAGPYIDFDRTDYQTRRAYTGLSELPEDSLTEAWARALTWINNSIVEVLKADGWTQDHDEMGGIVLSKSIEITGDIARVTVPKSVSILLETGFNWGNAFCTLRAKRTNRDNSTLHVEASHPCIADYFYLLPVLLPGLLGLVREDDFDDYGEIITTRLLPSSSWVEKQKEALIIIFGSEARYEEVLGACRARAFHEDRFSYNYHLDGRDDEVPDFTACDKECGYCGRCEY